ncbi:MAG: EamA family transporter [Calothrix sp. FI2-JRJ7]|jgi:transporter family protein|nr:EamA family transporter [Calothrix sp. FI2-JRJ7]
MIQGNGLIYALLSLILYGVWGLFSKFTTNYIDAKSVLVYETISAFLISLLLVAIQGFKIQTNPQGIFYAILVGVVGSLATFCFFVALKSSSVSIVVPLTALYPSITALLGLFFLKEPITFQQVLGIIFATISVILLSGK